MPVVVEYMVRSRVSCSSLTDRYSAMVVPTRLPSRGSRNAPLLFIVTFVAGVEGGGGDAAAPSSSLHPPPRTMSSSARSRLTDVGAAAAAAAVGVIFLVARGARERRTNITAV